MFRKEIITTADDYRELVKFTEYKRKKTNILIMGAAAVLAVIAAVLLILGVLPLIAGITAIAVCAGLFLFVPIKVNAKIKDGIKHGKVALNAKRTLEYDGSALKIYGGRTETDVNVRWERIFAIYEIENVFIIYLTHESAFCVSKSQLTPIEAINMRNYFIKKMQDRFYLLCKQ